MKDDKNDLRIYDAIDELIAYLEGSVHPTFTAESVRKIDMNDAMDLISQIRICLPDDIRKAQATLDQARSIIADATEQAKAIRNQAEVASESMLERARDEATKIVNDANRKREVMISEHEVTKEAEERAKSLIEQTREYCIDLYEQSRTNVSVLLNEAESCVRNCVKALHSERDRIGVRSAGTRYEPASEQEVEQNDDDVYPGETSQGYEDDDFEEQESAARVAAGKKSGGMKKIFDDFKKKFFPEDGDGGWDEDDDESFDSDDEMDE